ncbi:MAG: sulfatase [Opitutales bacterium]|nr:sulfatase [Opitutales bacterium]
MKNFSSFFFISIFLFTSTGFAQPKGQIQNILLIMSDDLRGSALPAYGDKICQTPNLDRLAAQSMVFDRAYCQGLLCYPSRPSMMRSTYPGSKIKPITLGEHLQKFGMHTSRVGKIFHMGVPNSPRNGDSGLDVPECWTEFHNTKSPETYTPGLYRQMNRGIATRKMEGRQGIGTKERYWAAVEADISDGSDQADYLVAEKAVQLIKERKEASKPFFMGVGFFRPHYPMVAPKKFFDLYPVNQMKLPPIIAGDLDDIPRAAYGINGGDLLNKSEKGRREMWQAYYASVTFMDEQLGKVLDELDRQGLTDSTAIVFTTDHGYHLGEHGFWKKGNLHEEVTRVPLMIRAPGVKPGRTDSLAELVDFYPTCTDLLGLPAPKKIVGNSLVPILQNPENKVRKTALSLHNEKHIKNKGYAIRSNSWTYMNYGDQGEILYDMVKDPHQYTNLIDNPDYLETVRKARKRLRLRLQQVQ